jgi:hypothetical protein
MIFVDWGTRKAVRDGRETKGDDVDQNEAARQEARVLPAREALSLIATDPLSPYGLADPVGGGVSAADAATLPDTQIEASGGGDASVSSQDRSESFERSDTASA